MAKILKSKIFWFFSPVWLIPLVMFILWFFAPKIVWNIVIIDKSSSSKDGNEHISLFWLLNQKRLSKSGEIPYQVEKDYWGFFPKENEKFLIHGLEKLSSSQIGSLSKQANMAYFADTYGIYKQEWFARIQGQQSEFGMLYGGLSSQDLVFLRLMNEQKKLVVAEFNTIGSPTSSANRKQFEELYRMKWSGWTARFFDNLDTTINLEIPRWMIKNYQNTHAQKWNFKKAGIAFVHEQSGRVVILEDQQHLINPLPYIQSGELGQIKFGLPASIKYPFWFDIIEPDLNQNTIVSQFIIQSNAQGRYLLRKNGIPDVIPAVLMAKNGYAPFYYFSGDFCDNPVQMNTSYFKGIDAFQFLFFNDNDPMERKSFFWKFYRPLMNHILDEANQKLQKPIDQDALITE
ncbi:hypothetical protein [Aquirufa ecclesiirivi]|uniref:hypothetical protein n=1 Tax=Aquirufa ecclesiirivi TaxID=2715124 RepID=UPI0023D87EE1|nr:hypothetical protein [Aquirufa ecclesiirivi]MDF0693667.1 hypothetical protein [Aquirufa ecclesiirivi]